ncbi:MAG: peptidoglycan-associated lipoprotein Pal [Gammaproteobacteria bacterium]|nr:peptidoglycan-associated lipoprotein Pal [Gammaproteobacteria bacterium]
MKINLARSAILILLALTLVGCSTFGAKDEQGDGAGAPVSEAGQEGGGSATSAAREGGVWRGNPLDNPDGPLATRVIYFDYDESRIHPDYQQIVISHGQYLAANPRVTLTVEGHADERGSREYNIALGERRAQAVKTLMLAQGAADSQIATVSYGEERPLVAGFDEAAWSQNRRAELLY